MSPEAEILNRRLGVLHDWHHEAFRAAAVDRRHEATQDVWVDLEVLTGEWNPMALRFAEGADILNRATVDETLKRSIFELPSVRTLLASDHDVVMLRRQIEVCELLRVALLERIALPDVGTARPNLGKRLAERLSKGFK